MATFARSDDLRGAEFVGADLTGARFVGADRPASSCGRRSSPGRTLDAPWLYDGESTCSSTAST